MGAKAPIFTRSIRSKRSFRSLRSYRSFSWGDASAKDLSFQPSKTSALRPELKPSDVRTQALLPQS